MSHPFLHPPIHPKGVVRGDLGTKIRWKSRPKDRKLEIKSLLNLLDSVVMQGANTFFRKRSFCPAVHYVMYNNNYNKLFSCEKQFRNQNFTQNPHPVNYTF